MANLFIKQVEYSGEIYYYKSPVFDMGLNIIEGRNGSGKTTLIDLICYALGDYVRQFDFTKANKHAEIFSDIDNYVEITIEIDNTLYLVRRYIKENSNKIFVREREKEISVFDIKRNGDNTIFSDWILKELGIEPVEIYQGRYRGKINFTDLLRLINYDQLTTPSKIYKSARLDGNFISDSIIIRKAIFEILVGSGVIDYYSALNRYVDNENAYNAKKSVSDFFIQSTERLYHINLNQINSFEDDIADIRNKLKEKENEQANIIENEYDEDAFNIELAILNNTLIDKSVEIQKVEKHQSNLKEEIHVLKEIIENRKIEIDQLEKIIFTHKELNLFAPNTCPYCFKKVNREEGHCVCGGEVEETSYQRYFYDTNEYVDMLIQRKRSIGTLNQAYIDLSNELEAAGKAKIEMIKGLEKVKHKINKLKIDARTNINSVGMQRIIDEIIMLEGTLKEKQEMQNVYIKYKELVMATEKSKEEFDIAKANLDTQQEYLKQKLEQVIKDFSEIYGEFLTKVLEGCESADIDKDYMPVINQGQYINASGNVPIRIVYYLSLLELSLQKNVKFPHLLIIDTPENLGIDEDNLIKALNLIENLSEGEYQILLTSGEGKYPKQFQTYIKDNLTEKKLLQKR